MHRKFIDIFRSKYDDGNVESRSSISLEKINTKKTIIENVEPVIDQPVPKNNIKHNHCQSESTDFVKQLCSQNPNDFAFESDKIKTEMENATEKGFKTEQKSSEVQNKKKVDIKDEQPEICSQTPNDFTSESDKIKTEMKNATKKGFKTEQKNSEVQNKKKVDIKDEQPEICSQTPNDFASESDKIKTEMKNTTKKDFKTKQKNSEVQNKKKVEIKEIEEPMNKFEPIMNITEESSTDLTSNRNDCSSDRLKCALCDKTFKTILELRTHANVHGFHGSGLLKKAVSKVKVFVKCGRCFKSFINLAYLKNHNLLKHDIHTCDLTNDCGTTFGTLRDLKKHWMSRHLLETTKVSEQEKMHLRANAIRKRCDFCNLVFPTLQFLHNHIMNNHMKSQQNQPKSNKTKTKSMTK